MTEQQTIRLEAMVRGRPRELHVSKAARDTYGTPDSLFSIQGHLLFADTRAARELAFKINRTRDTAANPDQVIAAGDLYAMGLIDEIFHYLIQLYRDQYGQDVFARLYDYVEEQLTGEPLEYSLKRFSELFPTVAHYQGRETVEESLERTVDGISGREIALEEMLVLWLSNRNTAYQPARELFDEAELDLETHYGQITELMQQFFESQPGFGPDDETLVAMFRQPAVLFPDSLQDQLEYIRRRWGGLIGDYLARLLRSIGVIAEEQKARFFGPGETYVLEYPFDDRARYSPDRDWMPRVVLVAKTALVWLDQLSKKYGYAIRTLDQVPDQELDRIASRGFTSVWLIGLWERSEASRRIKQIMGNAEAAASAYSLFDYQIAEELGGWDALDNLRRRMWQRGIRLASDMVPNHTGIDSKWVHEHPDWYVQLPYPPFPGYSFTGENLSTKPSVGIYLEDHYYDRSDAAVVFKRVDGESSQERYIYHGNDGTSMPWNDTAQLDYLNPEVREAVIQTILHVARNFPVIRFDAAMTLAKQHVQRLWYPRPGQGGDIPSRAEHGMTQEQFDQAIPEEFWREVVDRVQQEVPDTLLLAEAFWMMEGFFVRNLGMHRVYNSAFMNMLKMEDNEKYRRTMQNTLEYDPQILKRFVNFMNNPDEDTAVAQFGKDDKYFGVCTLMVTMPGLPMFGHGQIEGFAEKYGMEYRRAYWEETEDTNLIERHQREIFPLIHKRHLFADVERFRLFDLYDANGNVNHNVFAYSNGAGREAAFVLYNNSYYEARGWVQMSTAYAVVHGDGTKELRRDRLAAALGLTADYDHFVILQEQRSGLWFIRNSGEIHHQGMYVHLWGYQSQVYVNIYEVTDTQHNFYARLSDQLAGAGTADIDLALKRLALQPLHDTFSLIANSGVLRRLTEYLTTRGGRAAPVGTNGTASSTGGDTTSAARAGTKSSTPGAASQPGPGGSPPHATAHPGPATSILPAEDYDSFLRMAMEFTNHSTSVAAGVARFQELFAALDTLFEMGTASKSNDIKQAAELVTNHLTDRHQDSATILALLLLLPLEQFLRGQEGHDALAGFSVLDQAGEWLLVHQLEETFNRMHPENPLPEEWAALVQVLIAYHDWFDAAETAADQFRWLLSDSSVQSFLAVNTYQNVTYFNQERFEVLSDWLFMVAIWRLHLTEAKGRTRTQAVKALYETRQQWKNAERKSDYQLDRLLASMGVTT